MKARSWFCSLILLVSTLVLAAPSPLGMLQSTSDEMLNSLRANRASLKTNQAVVYRIVNSILVPHVDLEGMARSVLGRNVWLSATPEQRMEFTREFTHLVIHTYSSALAAYTNETVRFMPIRGGISGNRTQVQSLIVRRNGPSISLNYRLIYSGGEWRIYDFSVEGISILESFRSQFANDLASEDLDNLIDKLGRHNAAR